MTGVWRRFAVAAFSVSFALCPSSCKKPAPGDACTQNGKLACTSPAGGLLCQNGTLQSLPCRGPRGCHGVGAASRCDDDVAQEGDACQQTVNENDSCSADHQTELVCRDGKFAIARTCKGPKRCSVTGDVVACDDSLADVGDPCVAEPGEANYGCSTDKKIEVACDASSGKFRASNSCRGPRGCWIDANLPHCDDSFGREGEECHPADHRACGEDAKSELKCLQGKLVKVRDCRHGCRARSGSIECD